MQTDLFNSDIQVERLARDAGMAAAAAHADASSARWTALAFEFFRDFVATKAKQEKFFTEDARLAATKAGLPLPPDGRAWGAVTHRAARERIIKRVGYGPQRATGCHMAPKSIWTRA